MILEHIFTLKNSSRLLIFQDHNGPASQGPGASGSGPYQSVLDYNIKAYDTHLWIVTLRILHFFVYHSITESTI